MGAQDLDRIAVDVQGVDVWDKAVSTSSISPTPTPIDDDFTNGYIDPREERAFVRQEAQTLGKLSF